MENQNAEKTYEFDQYEGAESIPEEAIEHMRALAAIEFEQGNYDRAVDVFHDLVRLRPERADFWRDMGIAARMENHDYQALFCLQRAVRLDEDDRLIQLNLGEVLCRCGRPNDGLEVLKLVFENGYDADLAPEDHDDLTIRAGAILAATRKLAEEFVEKPA